LFRREEPKTLQNFAISPNDSAGYYFREDYSELSQDEDEEKCVTDA